MVAVCPVYRGYDRIEVKVKVKAKVVFGDGNTRRRRRASATAPSCAGVAMWGSRNFGPHRLCPSTAPPPLTPIVVRNAEW